MRKISAIFILLVACFALSSCSAQKTNTKAYKTEELSSEQLKGLHTAYFAAGCYWCVEAIYQNIKGVEQAVSGFSGGEKPDPTYREVASGQTDYAETVRVRFDPEIVTYRQLVKIFYASHNPTVKNRVGPDIGKQYRSAIFYTSDKQKKIATAIKNKIDASGQYSKPVVTKIVPFDAFYPASKYHQNYVLKHPNSAYVQQVSKPREQKTLSQFLELTAEEYLELSQ